MLVLRLNRYPKEDRSRNRQRERKGGRLLCFNDPGPGFRHGPILENAERKAKRRFGKMTCRSAVDR
jgi:hypothetical protein